MQSTVREADDAATVNPLAAWTDLSTSVLETVDAHAFCWSPPDYARFHNDMAECLRLLKDRASSSDILLAGANAARSIEQYQRDTQQAVESSLGEIHEMLGMLLGAVIPASQEHAENGVELRRIEKSIRETRIAEDLRAQKDRLAGALARLTKLGRVAGVHSAASPAAGPPSSSTEPLDPLTGLPSKAAAEKAILGLDAASEGAFLVVVYVQRMAHFNARLGDKLGNELLFLTTQRIANALLRPDDQMFRWRGPAFVALLRRPDTLVEVKREVKRVMSSRFQFDLRGGAMLVTPALVAESFAAGPGKGANLIREIEDFIALPSTSGF